MSQHDLAAPLDVDLLAGLDLADVDLDRRAGRLGALAREERHHERRRRRGDADAADHARRADQEAALPVVHTLPLPSTGSPVASRAVSGRAPRQDLPRFANLSIIRDSRVAPEARRAPDAKSRSKSAAWRRSAPAARPQRRRVRAGSRPARPSRAEAQPTVAIIRRLSRRGKPSLAAHDSGSSSRRPARCALPRCSSSRRCGRTCSPRSTGRGGQRRPAPGDVDAGRTPRGRDLSPTPRRRRCRRSSTSTRARRCASAARWPTTRCCAGTSRISRERLPRQRATSLGSGVIVSPRRLRAHQPPRDRGRRRHPARARRRPPARRRASAAPIPSPTSRC